MANWSWYEISGQPRYSAVQARVSCYLETRRFNNRR